MDTINTLDLARIREAANLAVTTARANHQAWHLRTAETACPWGCGDGSGIVGK